MSHLLFEASKVKEWKSEFLKQRPLLWTDLAPIAILSLTNPLFHSFGWRFLCTQLMSGRPWLIIDGELFL